MTTSATPSASPAAMRGQPSLAPIPKATISAAGRATVHRMACPNSSPFAAVAMTMTDTVPSGTRRAQAAGRVIATTARQATAPGHGVPRLRGAPHAAATGTTLSSAARTPSTRPGAGRPRSRRARETQVAVMAQFSLLMRSLSAFPGTALNGPRQIGSPPPDHRDGGHAEDHDTHEAEPDAGQALGRGCHLRGVDTHGRGAGEPGREEHEVACCADGRRDGRAVPGADGKAACPGPPRTTASEAAIAAVVMRKASCTT